MRRSLYIYKSAYLRLLQIVYLSFLNFFSLISSLTFLLASNLSLESNSLLELFSSSTIVLTLLINAYYNFLVLNPGFSPILWAYTYIDIYNVSNPYVVLLNLYIFNLYWFNKHSFKLSFVLTSLLLLKLIFLVIFYLFLINSINLFPLPLL